MKIWCTLETPSHFMVIIYMQLGDPVGPSYESERIGVVDGMGWIFFWVCYSDSDQGMSEPMYFIKGCIYFCVGFAPSVDVRGYFLQFRDIFIQSPKLEIPKINASVSLVYFIPPNIFNLFISISIAMTPVYNANSCYLKYYSSLLLIFLRFPLAHYNSFFF